MKEKTKKTKKIIDIREYREKKQKNVVEREELLTLIKRIAKTK